MKFLRRETLWSTVALLILSASYVVGWANGRADGNAAETAARQDPPVAAQLGAVGAVAARYPTPSPQPEAPTPELLAALFDGWEVARFTDAEVILRNPMAAAPQRYIIGAHEGYVAVYYDDAGAELLKEVTTTPLAALPETEQARLTEGILIIGAEQLAKALEDYGS